MGVTGNPVQVTHCERVQNTDENYRPEARLMQLNLALNNNPLTITANQIVFVRNNFQPLFHFDEKEANRTNNYRAYYFNGTKVTSKRHYINPPNWIYESQDEARRAAEQWSDTRVRNAQGHRRYIQTRDRMYLVDEVEGQNHFTFGGQVRSKRPLKYFYWPRNANTGRKENVRLFDTREEALEAARQMSAENVFNDAPRNSGDVFRPGFNHYEREHTFEVSYKSPEGERIKKRFTYDEEGRSYRNDAEALQAVEDFG